MDIYSWFEDTGHSAFINASLAFCAFFASVVAVGVSYVIQGRLKKIEEQRERDRLYDRRKARLKAVGIKEFTPGGGCPVFFQVENISEFAGARTIKIKLNANEYPNMSLQEQRQCIGPKSSVRILLPTEKYADDIVFNIIIEWEDDSGEPGHYESTISFL